MTANQAEALLSVEHVTCRLGGHDIVRELTLAIRRGEVLGLLGVNGAGKSTSLRMMAGLLPPTRGTVRLEGADLREEPQRARRDIGYLPEEPPLYAELCVEEYLRFCGRLHALAGSATRAAQRVIERCELGDVRHRLIGVLSRGFRQRVGLAQAIIHEPALIILDEPASGLDPVQALKLRELIAGLRNHHAVVLSTHVLSDVEACCDRVAILHQGRLRHEDMLSRKAATARFQIGVEPNPTDAAWRALPMVRSATQLSQDQRWHIELIDGAGVDSLVRALVERRFGVIEVREESAALDQMFLQIAATDITSEAA